MQGIKIADDPNIDAYRENLKKPQGLFADVGLFDMTRTPVAHFNSWFDKIASF